MCGWQKGGWAPTLHPQKPIPGKAFGQTQYTAKKRVLVLNGSFRDKTWCSLDSGGCFAMYEGTRALEGGNIETFALNRAKN